ncbi:MAG TPA: hypothetical protein VN613_00035, partial [Gemmatimonadaceae bacterium]|nr:hypothetical protein [Gemmatimonadaceae bacterium]
AALLTSAGLALFAPLERWILAHWTFDDVASRAVLVILAGMVAGGAIWKIVHGTKGIAWFLASGVAIGVALLLVTGS